MNDVRICMRCRKEEGPNEIFEQVKDTEYFQHLCHDCYLEWVIEQVDDEEVQERLYKELQKVN